MEKIMMTKEKRDVERIQKHFEETGELLCFRCDKPMKNQVDSITGEVSKYLWRCETKGCMPKDMILSVG